MECWAMTLESSVFQWKSASTHPWTRGAEFPTQGGAFWNAQSDMSSCIVIEPARPRRVFSCCKWGHPQRRSPAPTSQQCYSRIIPKKWSRVMIFFNGPLMIYFGNSSDNLGRNLRIKFSNIQFAKTLYGIQNSGKWNSETFSTRFCGGSGKMSEYLI